MERRQGDPTGDGDPAPDGAPTGPPSLSPAPALVATDDEERWRRAADFRRTAGEVRAIVRGLHPYAADGGGA
jgi:hypothetical protein